MVKNSIGFRKIYSLFYVIMIGAIGSGLWDVFLKDFLYLAGDFFVKIASSIYDGYFDRLYESVGKKIDVLMYLPGISLTAMILVSPVIMYAYMSIRLRRVGILIEENEDENEDEDEDENIELSKSGRFLFEQFKNHRMRFKLVLLFPMIVMSVLFFDIFIVATSNNSAVSVVERRVEIIRPYVSDNENYKIVSDFRLVDNRKKLQELITKIDQVADKNNITLPKLSLYGIESSNNRVN